MIRELYVKQFKRFKEERMELRPLTVLTGKNGAGKTSAIHALLLAYHASTRSDDVAELNGPFGIELGWFGEILNSGASDETFAIGVTDSAQRETVWHFTEGNTELYAAVEGPLGSESLSSRVARGFQYLSAERQGPRITQTAPAVPLGSLAVGCRGEYTAQVVDKLGSIEVPEPRRARDPDAPGLLKDQAERWLSRIVRPVQMDASTFPGTDIVALSFRIPGEQWVRPTNMGFGVTSTLPIVLAALTAPIGGLLIIENPEAHLHPAGQSEMGGFLTLMAAAGVQIILETHSDHVLNGIRRAIGEFEQIEVASAIVHFFGGPHDPAQPLFFTRTGGISEWPSGFFDQYQADIARISKVRRKQ